jgi:hypothetical protein
MGPHQGVIAASVNGPRITSHKNGSRLCCANQARASLKLLSEGQCQVLRTKAAGSGGEKHSRTKNPKTINQSADDDCANERPDKYDEPSAPSQGASNYNWKTGIRECEPASNSGMRREGLR